MDSLVAQPDQREAPKKVPKVMSVAYKMIDRYMCQVQLPILGMVIPPLVGGLTMGI